jgi:hypothetical protein
VRSRSLRAALAVVHSRRALGIAERELSADHPLIQSLRQRLRQLGAEQPPVE